MTPVLDLLRHEARARVFFTAFAQSALGTGAAYVALLVLAYDRFRSPWAIGLVLLADVVPAMWLGPLFGTAADRWSRRTCMVVADLLRAAAFVGVALADSFTATFACALLAGVGTGLFTPAALATLPDVVEEKRRVPAATSLYGALADLGFIAGPAIAAGAFLIGGPGAVLIGNGATFAVSAALLLSLRLRREPRGLHPRPSLLREAREALVATAGMRGLRVVLLATSVSLVFGGVFNVAELLLVKHLGGGDVAFSSLVTLYGVGFIAGSLSGSKGGPPGVLKRQWLAGCVLMATGFAASGLAPSIVVATLTFAAAGYGNGVMVVYERLLVQELVPGHLSGRVFGIRDAMTAWAFAIAFIAGPGVVQALGARATVATAGALGVLVWLTAALHLRGSWIGPREAPATPADELSPAPGSELGLRRGTGEQSSHFIGGG